MSPHIFVACLKPVF